MVGLITIGLSVGLATAAVPLDAVQEYEIAGLAVVVFAVKVVDCPLQIVCDAAAIERFGSGLTVRIIAALPEQAPLKPVTV